MNVDDYCPSQDWDRYCDQNDTEQCCECGAEYAPGEGLPCCTDKDCKVPSCGESDDFCSLECLRKYQE